MKSRPTCAALIVLAAIVAAPGVGAQRASREHHAFVAVADKNDAPVTNLGRADFTVKEDGISREVLSVAPAPPPSHIALLVDDSQVALPVVNDLRRGLLAFVGAASGWAGPPAVGLTTYGGRPAKRTDYSNSWPLIEREIGRLFPQPGSGAFMIDAVIETCQDLKKRNADRPIIVAFLVESSPEFSNDEHTRVADALKGAQASLWVIVLQEQQPDLSSTGARERAMVVGDVTAASGGGVTRVTSRVGVEAGFSRAVARIAARYDVTYARPDALVPPKTLSIDVSDPGLHVIAPHWSGR